MGILLSVFRWIIISSITASFLAVMIMLLKLLLKDRFGARWHYCIWFLVVIRLLIPYAPQSTFSIFNLFSIVNNSSNQSINKVPSINKPILIPQIKKNETLPNSPINEFPQHKIDNEGFKLRLLTAASLIWLLGMLLLRSYIMAGSFRFRLKLYYQQVCQDSDFLSVVSGCKKEMGISKKVAVIHTDLVKTPAICGFLKPMLLFPVGLKDQLCKDELKYILYHEFAHIKRKDLFFNYLIGVLQILHWFNPILWYTFYCMRQDAEIACDALALSHIDADDSKKYGETIIKLASIPRKNYVYGMAGIIGHKYQIKRRITMVSKFKKSTYKWTVFSVIVLVILSCILLTNAQSFSISDKKDIVKSNQTGLKTNTEKHDKTLLNAADNNNNSTGSISGKKSTCIEYKKICYNTIGKGTSILEYWKDTNNLMEKSMTSDPDGNQSEVTIVMEMGKRVIQANYKDGKADGSTWLLPSKIAAENKKLLSRSVFDTDKEEYTGPQWKIEKDSIIYDGKSVIKGVRKDTVMEKKGERVLDNIVYLDKVSGLPVKCETYEKGKLIYENTYEYKKYYGDPEDIFDCKGVDLKEVDPHIKDELGVG